MCLVSILICIINALHIKLKTAGTDKILQITIIVIMLHFFATIALGIIHRNILVINIVDVVNVI